MRRFPVSRAVWVTGVVVFLAGLLIFGVALNRDTSPKISDDAAVRAALASSDTGKWLRTHPYDRTDVIPLDRENARVSFFKGPRVVVEVAVAPSGKVIAVQFFPSGYVRAGNATVQHGLALLAGALLFLLLLAQRPLASQRNIDLAALAALTLTIWTVNERLFGWTMLLGVALMTYLLVRCLGVAARAEAPVAARFLVRFGESETQLLRLIAGAVALLAVFVTIPGGSVGDVSQASMSGATEILAGTMPYGHIMDGVVHGDTYPLFAYVLYTPAALIWPVHDLFDNLDGGLWIAAIALLAGAAAIFRAGRSAVDEAFGLRHAAAWLLFPPVLITASSGSNDLPTAALVAWALATFVHAGRTSTWLSAAAWAKVAPVFVLPLWLARFRGAQLKRALIAPVVLTLAMLALLLALGGTEGVRKMIDAIAFQSDRGAQLSFWVVTGAPALQIVVQAFGFGLAAAGAVAVWRSTALASSLVRVSALSAAVLLVFEIGASYWSYAYLPWVYPVLVVALLWPGDATRLRRSDGSPESGSDSGA
ncbi:MAG: hypothetical protein JHC98_07325 [Thermoleophilaceae bacterium]|nr:hypothetical protein [Thermoleophilaceae bacterium]